MKKLFLVFTFLTSYFIGSSQIINISTGVGAVGTADSWNVGTSTGSTTNAFVIPCLYCTGGTWETAPVAGTNAKWISVATTGSGSGMTDFYYEKSFVAPAGKKTLSCNFKIAADDLLKSVDLIKPDGSVINLPFTAGSAYHFTESIANKTDCPVEGNWMLRVKVFCGDPKGYKGPTGLLVSGNIQFNGQCQTQATYEDKRCCVGNNKINLSTGFDSGLISDGSNEDDWVGYAKPGGGSYTSIATNPFPGWAPQSSKAKWIKPAKELMNAGEYVYRKTLIVPPGKKANLTFSRIGADNDVSLWVTSPSSSDYSSNKSDYGFTASNVILPSCLNLELPQGTHYLDAKVQNVGSVTGLLIEGCYEFVDDCHCPVGWLGNTTNIDGGPSADGKCKKLVCGPMDIKPLPANGTPIGTWGFTWGNEIWVYGTKANGGEYLCKE